MVNGILPPSALKRDEIYSFIAGLYVSVVWYLYFGTNFGALKSIGITFYNSCILLTLWLASTVAVFLTQLYLSTGISSSLRKFCETRQEDELLNILGLDKARLHYFSPDYYHESVVYIHIIGLSFTSIPLVQYPAMSLLSFSIGWMWVFISIQISLILLLFYQYHRFWLCNCAYSVLRRKGRIEIYDEKKYSEEMSLALSKANILVKKEIDTTIQFDEALKKLKFLNHEFSFVEASERPDGTVEWKWYAAIQIGKNINMLFLKKFVGLEYILRDSDDYVLAVSKIGFADDNSMFMDSHDNDHSEDWVTLSCRQLSRIEICTAKRVSSGNCKIKLLMNDQAFDPV